MVNKKNKRKEKIWNKSDGRWDKQSKVDVAGSMTER